MSYSLCHFYYNWAGPVKVPAPCQYAHKIAEFFESIKVTKRRNNQHDNQKPQEMAVRENVASQIDPLNKKLYFL